jgi:hypothetical protein
MEILSYGPKAAPHYGSIRSALEKTGQSIGVNDLHIAAHARSEKRDAPASPLFTATKNNNTYSLLPNESFIFIIATVAAMPPSVLTNPLWLA